MFLKKRSIPNILTIFRIALVPIIIVLILVKSSNIYSFTINAQTYYFSLNYVIAGSFFVVACLTDFLDGYLARHNKWVSDFGKLWDPIADKILINSILICFAVQHLTLVWIPIVMIGRDIIVDALRMYAVSQKRTIAANIFGKLKTVFQMIGILIIFFVFNASNKDINCCLVNYYWLQNMFMYLALITSVVSGVIYFVKYSQSKQHK